MKFEGGGIYTWVCPWRPHWVFISVSPLIMTISTSDF